LEDNQEQLMTAIYGTYKCLKINFCGKPLVFKKALNKI